MPRPVWKGAITFGLVTIPVGLYSAVERKGELSFRLLHKKDSSRVEYKRFCAEENVEVPWSDIVKGYEYEKGQYVVMTDADFEKAKVPATQTVEITDFVPAGAIDFMYMEHPYYLAPASKQGVKAYALLRDALAETKRVGIGTIVIRQREQLVAVEPAGKTLSLTTMRFAHEIRDSEDLDVPDLREGYGIKEMDLARKLIDTLAGDWTPDKYRDTYTEVLKQAIQQKVEGKEITVGERPAKTAKVVNLMDALRASLQQKTAPKPTAAARGEEPRELAKAGGRNATAAVKRRRARAGRAS